MKKAALIYALWEKNLPVLQHYLQGRSRIVIVPASMATPALRQVVEHCGSKVLELPSSEVANGGTAAPAVLEEMRKGPSSIGLADDDIAARIVATLSKEVASELPVVENWIDALEAIGQKYEIEIAVINEDTLREGKTLALWSRRQGIPVLHVAHGTGMGRNYAGERNLSDQIAVWSARSAEYFEDLGIPRENIHLVGNSAWDALAALRKQRDALRTQLANATGLPLAATWILWGSAWNARLSALDDRESTIQMHEACRALVDLKAGGRHNAVLIYKDRFDGDTPIQQMQQQFMRIAQEHGVAGNVLFSDTHATQWIAASDVVVSYDSNLSIEAILCGVPAINVITPFGAIVGGAFGTDEGVLTVEAHEVAPVIARLCDDPGARAALIAAADARQSYYHDTTGGSAASRTAALIERCARRLPDATIVPYVWREYLDTESADIIPVYHTNGRADLAAIYTNHPSLILDIGCAAGSTTALIKTRFPGSRAWGIEMNRAAAAIAAQKLDRVLVGKFEDFDLESEGIAKGTIDAVLLADVLEHMYNPWDVMVRLRPYLSPSAQVLISIPNVRNMALFEDLAKGNWNYAASGLLDITHIRFFTLNEARRLCKETGYRIVQITNTIDSRMKAIWAQHGNMSGSVDVDLGRMTLKGVTREELLEWCSLQFYLLLEIDQPVARA